MGSNKFPDGDLMGVGLVVSEWFLEGGLVVYKGIGEDNE